MSTHCCLLLMGEGQLCWMDLGQWGTVNWTSGNHTQQIMAFVLQAPAPTRHARMEAGVRTAAARVLQGFLAISVRLVCVRVFFFFLNKQSRFPSQNHWQLCLKLNQYCKWVSIPCHFFGNQNSKKSNDFFIHTNGAPFLFPPFMEIIKKRKG